MKGNLDVKKYFDSFDFRILIPPEPVYPTRERSVFQEIIQCCGNQLISHSVSFVKVYILIENIILDGKI